MDCFKAEKKWKYGDKLKISIMKKELVYVYTIPKVKGHYKSWIFKCGNLLHYVEKDGYIQI